MSSGTECLHSSNTWERCRKVESEKDGDCFMTPVQMKRPWLVYQSLPDTGYCTHLYSQQAAEEEEEEEERGEECKQRKSIETPTSPSSQCTTFTWTVQTPSPSEAATMNLIRANLWLSDHTITFLSILSSSISQKSGKKGERRKP